MSPLVAETLMQANEILNGLHARRLVNNADKERLRIHQNNCLISWIFFIRKGLLTPENSSAIITQLLDFEDTDNHLVFILHMLKRGSLFKRTQFIKTH